MIDTAKQSKKQIEKTEILNDYRIAVESREISLTGRKEVFMGKAKFGIFGDGKELAQIAMAKAFKNGDWRSGYYRDQTFMLAIDELTPEQFFAQLYAHTDVNMEPHSGGRQMNGHYATRLLDDEGEWVSQTDKKITSSDLSPTAAQIPRLLGFAFASKLYRQNKDLSDFTDFSINGNEVAFGTIGNASTSEGHFFEAMNAAGVLQVPMVMAVWDDGYGISVPKEYHTIKESISKALSGFQRNENEKGFEIYVVKGWDYLGLIEAFKSAAHLARTKHIPSLIHVIDMTQPQGHSTSGSHERYKSKQRLKWEADFDCNLKFKEWILSSNLATEEELTRIENEAKQKIKQGRDSAWKMYFSEIKSDKVIALDLLDKVAEKHHEVEALRVISSELRDIHTPVKANIVKSIRESILALRHHSSEEKANLRSWYASKVEEHSDQYNSHINSQSRHAAVNVAGVKPEYSEGSKLVDGREVVQACFDHHLSINPLVFAMGEDVGRIGDVNQGFAGLQEKHGEIRVMDTSIRETSIIGQGIGAALRGLRPIAEIQYLDYIYYAIQTLSDDLASLHYRTKGGQKAPLIIRTRGHRLEGIWHSGSPMGMIINAVRGIHVLVPRNMTQATGFYNTLLASDDPAIVVESLNGYRLKEKLPDNLGEIRTPLGIPEILYEGTDISIVTYGSMCRMAVEAAKRLSKIGISMEVIDVQSLLPFDLSGTIVGSIKKTNRVIFADEDVPGGASAFMMRNVLDRDQGYQYLDSSPITLTAKEHRPAYGTDGDYFSKPSVEDIVETAYNVMSEADPIKFPALYR
ncbi:MAG: transketolase [Cyclobacteriaceae bacterium]